MIDLRCGDSRELLKTLPDNHVDYVITSPPYNKSERGHFGHGKWNKVDLHKGYGAYKDNLPWPDYVAWQKETLTELWRVLKPRGAIFYNHKPRPYDKQIQLPTELNPGLPLRQIIIWHTKARVNYSPYHWVPAHEWIMVFAGPEFRLPSRGAGKDSDVWQVMPNTDPRHPAPFPEEIPRRILRAVRPGGIVLDPYLGSGTSGKVATEMGFDFIGFELDPGYFALSQERLGLSPALAA